MYMDSAGGDLAVLQTDFFFFKCAFFLENLGFPVALIIDVVLELIAFHMTGQFKSVSLPLLSLYSYYSAVYQLCIIWFFLLW